MIAAAGLSPSLRAAERQRGVRIMYLTEYLPPEKRRRFAPDGMELRLTEAAVMLAFAMYLFEQGAKEVLVHPDGEHAKVFEIVPFLEGRGFQKTASKGTTAYGGRYEWEGRVLVIDPSSGLGDVTAEIGDIRVVAECKGGCVNSTHAGQKSKLRRGFCELVGQLMILPVDGARHVAVIPATAETELLATRLQPRCAAAGLEIAFVERDGRVRFVDSGS